MIDRNDIAEIYEALGDPRASQARPLADEDRADDAAWHRDNAEIFGERIDKVIELIDQVPDARGNAKHDQTCWIRHAACLAEMIRNIVED